MDEINLNRDKTIIIWTEGGKEIGMGHVCRSLIIAHQLRREGKNVLFLINDELSAIDRIKHDGFTYEVGALNEPGFLDRIPKKANIILIDTKKPITGLIKALRHLDYKVILMDNTTPARLKANSVIYPTAIFENNLSWNGFKGEVYGGVDYIPVADSFIKARKEVKHLRFQSPYQILVTMGGSDPNHLTYKVVSSLLKFSESVNIKVVIGPEFSTNTNLEKIKTQKHQNIEFIENISDLSLIMAESHIGITALGITIYEFAALGVPAIIISNFREDEKDMEALKKLEINIPLGSCEDVNSIDIASAVKKLISDKQNWMKIRNRCWNLIDGAGPERIARLLTD